MYIKVRVYPGMKKESITKVGEDSFEVITKAPAERNLANVRVRELIAVQYEVPVSAVRFVTGHHSPSKILEVIRGDK
ncbi:MAG: DUF167 domain-containing protein [Candidatus Pacebacteria bacterium]|nr:DUF167 domain-containing protein [Candidatus Paceibacterota bacterium]MBP9842597.1 DUF167 domain-containing protein [Candidatus Paceibacterota bacterium]